MAIEKYLLVATRVKLDKAAFIFFLILSLFSCTPDRPVIKVADGVYISNVTVITSETGDYQPYLGYVATDGNEIVYIGDKEPKLEGDFITVDGSDKYLIPGLIDSHVHVTEVLGMLPHHTAEHPKLAEEFNRQQPRSYLYFGFTTLINLGGISQEQLQFFNSQPLKPGLYHTGRSGASVANGYPMNFAPEEFRFEGAPNFIYLESEADNIPEQYNPKDHTPEAVVERIVNSGGIAVKTYYEKGFHGMPELPVPTPDIINSLQREAEKHGVVLTAHANSLQAHEFLTKHQVDIVAHGLWNWEHLRDVPQDSLPEEIKTILDQQIALKMGYTPTLTVIEGEAALMDSEFLQDPQLQKVLPKALIDWYRTEEGKWFRKQLFGDYAPEAVRDIYALIQAHGQKALKYHSDHDGNILFGTDTPSGPIYGNPPGYNGYIEMQLMFEAGVPLEKILQSATISNALAFKLDSTLGSIVKGKTANMLLLNKNPLKEIDAYDSIESIILEGNLVGRNELEANRNEE